MPALDIKLQGDGAFQDWHEQHGQPIHLGNDAVIRVVGLDNGMESGRASIAFGFLLPDGRWVLAETSLRLFLVAADVLKVRFGDPI